MKAVALEILAQFAFVLAQFAFEIILHVCTHTMYVLLEVNIEPIKFPIEFQNFG